MPDIEAILATRQDILTQVVFFGLLYLFFRVSLGWFVRVVLHRPYEKNGLFARVLRWGCLVGAILSLLALGWSFIEPYYPEVVYVRISSPKIGAPVRLVQLSDIHSDPVTRAEEKIAPLVRGLKPDAILFTGDGFNIKDGVPHFYRVLQELRQIAPVYGVRGNWETLWFTKVDIYGPTGMVDLEGHAVPAGKTGSGVWLSGSTINAIGAGLSALRATPDDAYRVFLVHFPAHWRSVEGVADLCLSGDTHGGQVRIPGLGPLVGPRVWDRIYYDNGLQKPGKHTLLYVNRGIGMMGGMNPRVRFNCRPEITVFDLVPASRAE